jgi:hypothetical protein
LNIILSGNQAKNFQLDIFDVAWLIILHKKLFELIFKVLVAAPEDQEVDMAEDIEGDLIALGGVARGHQGDQRVL